MGIVRPASMPQPGQCMEETIDAEHCAWSGRRMAESLATRQPVSSLQERLLAIFDPMLHRTGGLCSSYSPTAVRENMLQPHNSVPSSCPILHTKLTAVHWSNSVWKRPSWCGFDESNFLFRNSDLQFFLYHIRARMPRADAC